jgi:hypothetical protein
VRLGTPEESGALGGARDARPSSAALAILAAAMAASAAALLYVGRDQVIRGDELGYAARLASDSFGHALLHSPPNKYLIAVPLVLYDAMFELFGLAADLPYRVVVTALVLLCAGLFFMLARRRVGDLFALAPTVLLLFFGTGWETVLTPIRIPSLIAVASGLGGLIALERRTTRADIAAAALVTASVASHPTGLAFLAAAGVLVVLRPPPERFTRLWVPAIPAAVFGAWWLFLRPPTTEVIFPTRAIDVITFIRDSWTAIVADVSGLAGVIDTPSFDQAAARVAAVLLLALIVGALVTRWRRVPSSFWAALAALVVLMGATRLSPGGFIRAPDEVRYLYPLGVLFLLLLTEVAAILQVRGWAALGATAVLSLGLVYNLDKLRDGGATARTTSQKALGEYSAYEVAGRKLKTQYKPGPTVPPAGDYIAAADAYGSAADSPSELVAAPLPVRRSADVALVGSLGIEVRRASRNAPAGSRAPKVSQVLSGQVVQSHGCVRLEPPPQPNPPAIPRIPLNPNPSPERALKYLFRGEPVKPIPTVPELAELDPRGRGLRLHAPEVHNTAVLLGRFAQPPSGQLPRPGPGRAAWLRIPAIGPGPPWRATLAASDPVTVCGL